MLTCVVRPCKAVRPVYSKCENPHTVRANRCVLSTVRVPRANLENWPGAWRVRDQTVYYDLTQVLVLSTSTNTVLGETLLYKRRSCAPRNHGLQTSRGLFCVQPGHTRSSGNGPFSLDIATSAGKQRPEAPRFRRWSRNALNFGFEPAECKAEGSTRDIGGGWFEQPRRWRAAQWPGLSP